MFRGLATYGCGQSGCQYSPAVTPARSLPQNNPEPAQQMLVQPDDTIVQQLSPMGVRLPAPTTGATVVLTPARHGLLYVGGVRSLNAPDQVEIVRLSVGNGGDIARNAEPFDSAAFATEKCFCPVDWGCANQIGITLRGLVPNASLNWVLFGTYQQSWNSCYPSLGTVEEHAAAVWGLVHGRDAGDRDNIRRWRAEVRGPAIPTRELLAPSLRASTKRLANRVRGCLTA